MHKYPQNFAAVTDQTLQDHNEAEIAKNRKEELTLKLEAMGYDVGYRFAERYVQLRAFIVVTH